MEKIINGIQQMGIGVADAKAVFNWYRKTLGFDVLVFEDVATASLMTRYTNNIPQDRYALLAMNMRGGGGLEIWQFRNREPQSPERSIRLGDLGINIMKVGSKEIDKVYRGLKEANLDGVTEMGNKPHFFFTDPWGNWVQIVENKYIFCNTKFSCNGVLGAVIGVSDMESSLPFYQKLLGYGIIANDRTGTFDDFLGISGGERSFRRVLLKHPNRQVGGFGELYGPSEVELIQVLDRKPGKIYERRMWGDLGYIHLCFDVHGMDALRKEAKILHHPFTVDSAESFDMGKAAGRFGYIEDPDGTLIEIVETHKVPILKSLGINIDLKNRNPKKPLPKWMVGMLKFHRKRKDL